MIQINEFELTKGVIVLIGGDLGIERYEDESNDDYVDRIIEQLRISVGKDDPCKMCKR